jgi:membrane-associated protease RseP (regulator of RpoE activity)
MPEFPRGEFPRVHVPGGQGNVFTTGANARQIGVGITPLTKQLADHFGVTDGLLVNEVRDGSPASKAGLKAGDIIVEADGKALKGQIDLIRSINEKKEGDVRLTIVRGGSRQTITVTPEAAKDGGFFYQFDDKDMPDVPASPAEPGQFRLVRPATPPAPLMTTRPGRIV